VPEESFFWTLWMLERTTRGRHTDNPGGRHSIKTNQHQSPYFTPDALPVATLQIYPGLGQAQEYAGLHTPVAWLLTQLQLLKL